MGYNKAETLDGDARVREYEWLQATIDTEYALIDNRLHWMLLLHAMIFGAIGITVSEKVPQGSAVFPVVVGLSVFGLGIAWISKRAIGAGVAEIRKLKLRRTKLFERISIDWGIQEIGTKVTDRNHAKGLAPAQAFPRALILIWLLGFFVMTLNFIDPQLLPDLWSRSWVLAAGA